MSSINSETPNANGSLPKDENPFAEELRILASGADGAPLSPKEKLERLETVLFKSGHQIAAGVSAKISLGTALIMIEEERLYEYRTVKGEDGTERSYTHKEYFIWLAKKLGTGCSPSSFSKDKKAARTYQALLKAGCKVPSYLGCTVLMPYSGLDEAHLPTVYNGMMEEADGQPTENDAIRAIAKFKGVPAVLSVSSIEKLKKAILSKIGAAIVDLEAENYRHCRTLLVALERRLSKAPRVDAKGAAAKGDEGRPSIPDIPQAVPMQGDETMSVPPAPIADDHVHIKPIEGEGWQAWYDEGAVWVKLSDPHIDRLKEILKTPSHRYAYKGAQNGWSRSCGLGDVEAEFQYLREALCT